MSIDRIVLIAAWALTLLLIVLIPKAKRHDAIYIFMTAQTYTWVISLLFVELHLVENPVREFPRAVSTNFTFNYALYPLHAVYFTLYYPRNKKLLRKTVHMLLAALTLTAFQYLMAHYTNLVKIVHLEWYKEFAVVFITFALINRSYRWFRRNKPDSTEEPHR